MRINIASATAFVLSIFLGGCFGDGGSSQSAYDGVWQVNASDTDTSGIVLGSNQSANCTFAAANLTISNAVGTVILQRTCIIATTDNTIGSPTYGDVTYTANAPTSYPVTVSINLDTAVVAAIMNGTNVAGACISTVGCSAHATGKTLSLVR